MDGKIGTMNDIKGRVTSKYKRSKFGKIHDRRCSERETAVKRKDTRTSFESLILPDKYLTLFKS